MVVLIVWHHRPFDRALISFASIDIAFRFFAFSSSDVVQQDMNKLSFPAPSHIQAQAWPVAMKGRDMIGIAETGSGKTLAFAVPALLHVANQVWKR